MKIPFYKTYTTSESSRNIGYLIDNPEEIGKKVFTKKCEQWFEEFYPGYKALLVNSCTRALELMALSLNLGPQDEVIMPSFNYVGVANAFAQTGVKIKFVDIDPISMNASYRAILEAVSEKTKAIVVMNYAGIAGEWEKVRALCNKHKIVFVEDNAQGIQSYKGKKKLGSYGDLSCISFDSLKNISCGEGGVLLYKEALADSIEVVFHNGTNRIDFEKGKVDAYEWVALGSKFSISEYNAALLFPLLEQSADIIKERRAKWDELYNSLYELEAVRYALPIEMSKENHNAHIFYLKLKSNKERDGLMHYLNDKGIQCSFHYTPLHSSKYGIRQSISNDQGVVTTKESRLLLRMPIFNSMDANHIARVQNCVKEFYNAS